MSGAARVRQAATAALARKAEDLVVLDLGGLSLIADYFLICCGASTTQVRSIAEAIDAALEAAGGRVRHREGLPESGWVLLDYGDIVAHVFLPEMRTFYALERLWGDAPSVPVEADG